MAARKKAATKTVEHDDVEETDDERDATSITLTGDELDEIDAQGQAVLYADDGDIPEGSVGGICRVRVDDHTAHLVAAPAGTVDWGDGTDPDDLTTHTYPVVPDHVIYLITVPAEVEAPIVAPPVPTGPAIVETAWLYRLTLSDPADLPDAHGWAHVGVGMLVLSGTDAYGTTHDAEIPGLTEVIIQIGDDANSAFLMPSGVPPTLGSYPGTDLWVLAADDGGPATGAGLTAGEGDPVWVCGVSGFRAGTTEVDCDAVDANTIQTRVAGPRAAADTAPRAVVATLEFELGRCIRVMT